MANVLAHVEVPVGTDSAVQQQAASRREMTQLKAVFFDAAGTLFEPREPIGQSYARIAREYGVDAKVAEVDKAFRLAFHNSPALAFGPGRGAPELRRLEREWWRDLVEKTFAGLGNFRDFAAYFDALFSFFAEPEHWVADPGAGPLLADLRERGLALGVISNFDYRLYGILDGLGLSQFFDSITISSEAGFAKPSKKLFEAALAHHQIAAIEAMHVGDSEHLDQAGAASAGIRAILIDRSMPEPLVMITGSTARISSLRATLNAVRAW
jgi:putative hydrolase of the HAD superfamily